MLIYMAMRYNRDHMAALIRDRQDYEFTCNIDRLQAIANNAPVKEINDATNGLRIVSGVTRALLSAHIRTDEIEAREYARKVVVRHHQRVHKTSYANAREAIKLDMFNAMRYVERKAGLPSTYVIGKPPRKEGT